MADQCLASFSEPDEQSVDAAASPLTAEQAREIVAPLYEALKEPSKKDVAALLARAANSDYGCYSTNEGWLTRDQLAEVFKTLGSAIPDLSWTIKDVLAIGDQIVVRGEITGTPTGQVSGARPTGNSFKSMSIDVFTIYVDERHVLRLGREAARAAP